MSKKKTDISEYITAHVAAQLLTVRYGREIHPGYVNRIRSLTRFRVHATLMLYLRADVEQVQLRAANKRATGTCQVTNA